VAAQATWAERKEAHHWTGAHLRRENGGPNDTQCTHHTTLLVQLVLTTLNVLDDYKYKTGEGGVNDAVLERDRIRTRLRKP